MDQEDSIMNDIRGANYVPGRMDAIIRMGKKSIHYAGRAIEEGTITTHRLDNGFWTPAMQEVEAIIKEVHDKDPKASVASKARVLAGRTGRTEEACRSLIRRSGRGVVEKG